MSDYAKDHSPKRGNKVGVAPASSGTEEAPTHKQSERDVKLGEGLDFNAVADSHSKTQVKDAKHNNSTPRANALNTWMRGVTGQHAADGAHDKMPSKQATGHKPYHKPNATARANGMAMWQEGVDSKHSELGEHDVPNQFNNQ
jgi:hypothetical protein